MRPLSHKPPPTLLLQEPFMRLFIQSE